MPKVPVLTLSDLALLMKGAVPVDGVLTLETRTVWELLNDDTCLAAMSDDGQVRVKQVCDALTPALELRGRVPLSDAVEGTWLRLRGPACLRDERPRHHTRG